MTPPTTPTPALAGVFCIPGDLMPDLIESLRTARERGVRPSAPGANLSGANLTRANLYGADLKEKWTA